MDSAPMVALRTYKYKMPRCMGDRGTENTRSTKITNNEDIEAIEKPQIITSETEIRE